MFSKMLLTLVLLFGHFTFGYQADVAVPPGVSGGLFSASGDVDPDFVGPIQNVTVAVGREAILSCTVTELGHYKVGWMKAEDQTILTLHTRVVTHNARISVTHDNLRTWQLRIRQLKESDRGCYMCQINTSTMKKQVGCVDVHVPPDIKDEETSGDITVSEGENATLVCRATGHPPPRILWRREDGSHLVIRKGSRDIDRVDTFSGDTLTLTKLERRQMGAYLCIASNDVPPAVSKRILLNINFEPSIKVPNQLLGAPLNTDVQLECYVEAFPNTVNYWVKRNSEMLLNGRKHVIAEERTGYKVHLQLTIKNYSRSDVGTYMCVSTNSMGRADGTIRLYEIKVATKPPTTTTEMPIVTMASFELTSPSPEPELEHRSVMAATTIGKEHKHNLSPIESLVDDSILENAIPPSDTTIPREYSANYASGASCDSDANVRLTVMLVSLLATCAFVR